MSCGLLLLRIVDPDFKTPVACELSVMNVFSLPVVGGCTVLINGPLWWGWPLWVTILVFAGIMAVVLTLMKLMAGNVAADGGTRFLRPGLTVGYMAQDPDFGGFATLGDFAAHGVDETDHWRVDMAMDGLKLDAGLDPKAASGGERRRAALAQRRDGAPMAPVVSHRDTAKVKPLSQRATGAYKYQEILT